MNPPMSDPARPKAAVMYGLATLVLPGSTTISLDLRRSRILGGPSPFSLAACSQAPCGRSLDVARHEPRLDATAKGRSSPYLAMGQTEKPYHASREDSRRGVRRARGGRLGSAGGPAWRPPRCGGRGCVAGDARRRERQAGIIEPLHSGSGWLD